MFSHVLRDKNGLHFYVCFMTTDKHLMKRRVDNDSIRLVISMFERMCTLKLPYLMNSKTLKNQNT